MIMFLFLDLFEIIVDREVIPLMEGVAAVQNHLIPLQRTLVTPNSPGIVILKFSFLLD